MIRPRLPSNLYFSRWHLSKWDLRLRAENHSFNMFTLFTYDSFKKKLVLYPRRKWDFFFCPSMGNQKYFLSFLVQIMWAIIINTKTFININVGGKNMHLSTNPYKTSTRSLCFLYYFTETQIESLSRYLSNCGSTMAEMRGDLAAIPS